METLIFKKLKKQVPVQEPEHNHLGFNTIEILRFNYDGRGNALTLEDGQISYCSGDDLRFIFFSGWYMLEYPKQQ